jgi:hypothetical protein
MSLVGHSLPSRFRFFDARCPLSPHSDKNSAALLLVAIGQKRQSPTPQTLSVLIWPTVRPLVSILNVTSGAVGARGGVNQWE